MKLDVMAFAAHRDDTEITVGGTLAKLVEQGCAVGVCDLTQGEMGTRGTAAERAAEAEEARRILGLAVRVNCEIPDAGVFNVREQQLRVVDVLRRFKPETVIVPGLEQRHPDHRITPQLVFDACYFAGLAKLGTGEPHRPRKILWVHSSYSASPPTFVVDISAQIEKKIAAVRAYKSQFDETPHDPKAPLGPKVFDWIRDRGRAYGLMIGKAFGEGFVQREVMEVADVAKLPGSSM
jgi:bacillithiol biosynthesis deacetylase BshB1